MSMTSVTITTIRKLGALQTHTAIIQVNYTESCHPTAPLGDSDIRIVEFEAFDQIKICELGV